MFLIVIYLDFLFHYIYNRFKCKLDFISWII